MTEHQFRVAVDKDFVPIKNILMERAEWLKKKEIQQWTYLLSGGEDEEIKQGIESSETYVLTHDNEVIATLVLSAEQSDWDKQLWGRDGNSVDTCYLHRLAVRLDNMGEGWGKSALKWAEGYLKGKAATLRLDCVADNKKLNFFYRDQGFHYVGTVDGHCKYEKSLS